MPIYQNSTVNTSLLLIGNYKIETAAFGTSVGGTWINLGAGKVNSFDHAVTKYNVQAGNAPDPLEGIAQETFVVDLELIEFDGSILSAISCGIMTGASAATQFIITGGGATTLTPRAFKLTNRRYIAGATKDTVIIVYKATLDTGLQITAKSDNDTDPIAVMPVKLTGKLDANASIGNQLYTIIKTL